MAVDPKNLRRTFKAKARTRQYADFVLGLSVNEIAALSAPQVIRLIDTTSDLSFALSTEVSDYIKLQRRTRTGMMLNPDIRQWYTAETRRIAALASADVNFVWKGPSTELQSRRETAFDNLLTETDTKHFMIVRQTMETALRDTYAAAGLTVPIGWHRKRLVEGMFPRQFSLRPQFRVYSNAKALRGFTSRVHNVMATLPAYVRQFVDMSGHDIRMAKRLGFIDQTYATEGPSYARGKTYEQTAMGIYKPAQLSIDLPELILHTNAAGNTQTYLAHGNRPEELLKTVAHEIGHGISSAMGDVSYMTPVCQAYSSDINAQATKLQDAQRKGIGYFLDIRHGGVHPNLADAREEALVEIIAEKVMDEVGRPSYDISEYFPDTKVQGEKVLRMLATDYTVMPTGLEFPCPNALRTALRPPVAQPNIPRFNV